MALTPFQRDVCRLLAGNRLRSGESYVAGGAALNTMLAAPRLSRDVGLFHDTEQALAASWAADRDLLEREAYVTCDREVQPLGYLAWAACGKDPGFSPTAILELASRSARYSDVELRALDFEGEPPDAAALAHRWKAVLEAAREIVGLLPTPQAGRAVLARDATPSADRRPVCVRLSRTTVSCTTRGASAAPSPGSSADATARWGRPPRPRR
jgi:hypothetical protein